MLRVEKRAQAVTFVTAIFAGPLAEVPPEVEAELSLRAIEVRLEGAPGQGVEVRVKGLADGEGVGVEVEPWEWVR